MATYTNQEFLTQTLPTLLGRLEASQEPNFGLMSAQHMIEHLIWTTKSFTRRKEKPADWQPTKSALGFQRFLAKGAPFEYRPKEGQSKADLSPLRMESMESAINTLMEAISDMYAFGEEDPNYHSFNPFSGEFNMKQMDLLIGQHCRWHCYQFGLLPAFSPQIVVD